MCNAWSTAILEFTLMIYLKTQESNSKRFADVSSLICVVKDCNLSTINLNNTLGNILLCFSRIAP